MIYPYACRDHGEFELVESSQGRHLSAPCPICGRASPRVWTGPQIHGAAVGEAEYNHGLGCVTRTAADRREALKRHNGEHPDEHLVEYDGNMGVSRPERQRYPTASELGIT